MNTSSFPLSKLLFAFATIMASIQHDSHMWTSAHIHDEVRKLKGVSYIGLDNTLRICSVFNARIYKHLSGSTYPDRRDVFYFLGLLEGTTKTHVPNRWRDALINCSPMFRFMPDELRHDSHEIELYKHKLSTRTDVMFDTTKEHVVYDRRYNISECVRHLLLQAGSTNTHIDCFQCKKYICVALYNELGDSYNISLLRKDTLEVLWTRKVWAMAPTGTSGTSTHEIDIVWGFRDVAVYGIVNADLYVEQFDIDSGRATVRFSTTLWGRWP